MSKLFEDILSFLSSATSEQLEENWKDLEPYENVGPMAEEFVEYCREIYQYSLQTVNNSFINHEENPEYSFGFFSF